MLARKCDRCGDFYEPYNGEELFKDGEMANNVQFRNFYNDRYYYMKKYDLCPKCMELMQRFINNEIEELGGIYVYPSNEKESNR